MIRQPHTVIIVDLDAPAVALCAAAAETLALCAATALPAGDDVPEWINLLPAGAIITTVDGRGPYRVPDAAALVRASLHQAAGPMVIDENHATDLAAPKGEAAPARGWIVDLEARADGIWGKVEWTRTGRRLMADRAYRYISPVISHGRDGTVLDIRRASLVNKPNLRGLVALQQEIDMDLLARLAAAIGLAADTSEEAALTAVAALHAQRAQVTTALQAALDPVAAALGLQAGADQAAVLAGIQQIKAGGDQETIVALQAELVGLANQVKSLTDAGRKKAAEVYVDAEIKRGRVGMKPLRDRYVSMHMADPAGTEELIGALPVLGGGGEIVPSTPPAPGGQVALNAAETQTARLLGLSPQAMADTLKAEREAAL